MRAPGWGETEGGDAAAAVGAGVGKGVAMTEERVIASWKYTKGTLDEKTASLCYLAANLAAGNTH